MAQDTDQNTSIPFRVTNLHTMIVSTHKMRNIAMGKVMRVALLAAADGKFALRDHRGLKLNLTQGNRDALEGLAAEAEQQSGHRWWTKPPWTDILGGVFADEKEFLSWLDHDASSTLPAVETTAGSAAKSCIVAEAKRPRMRPVARLYPATAAPLPAEPLSDAGDTDENKPTPRVEPISKAVDALSDAPATAPQHIKPGDCKSEGETRTYLWNRMTEFPQGDPDGKTKADHKKHCQQFGVSAKAFDRIWGDTIAETGATSYSASGPRGPHKPRTNSK